MPFLDSLSKSLSKKSMLKDQITSPCSPGQGMNFSQHPSICTYQQAQVGQPHIQAAMAQAPYQVHQHHHAPYQQHPAIQTMPPMNGCTMQYQNYNFTQQPQQQQHQSYMMQSPSRNGTTMVNAANNSYDSSLINHQQAVVSPINAQHSHQHQIQQQHHTLAHTLIPQPCVSYLPPYQGNPVQSSTILEHHLPQQQHPQQQHSQQQQHLRQQQHQLQIDRLNNMEQSHYSNHIATNQVATIQPQQQQNQQYQQQRTQFTDEHLQRYQQQQQHLNRDNSQRQFQHQQSQRQQQQYQYQNTQVVKEVESCYSNDDDLPLESKCIMYETHHKNLLKLAGTLRNELDDLADELDVIRKGMPQYIVNELKI